MDRRSAREAGRTNPRSASDEAKPLSNAVLDRVLQRAPLHIFVFDRRSVCRYAAPVANRFLEQSRDELRGCTAAELLPPAEEGLPPMLNRILQGGIAWEHPAFRYTYHGQAGASLLVWRVHAAPLSVGAERWAVLTLQDALPSSKEQMEHAAEDERLRNENDELRAALVRAHGRETADRRKRHELRSRVRNLLAPVAGYLQVIAWRPAILGNRRPSDVIEDTVLPQLQSVTTAVDSFDECPGDWP